MKVFTIELAGVMYVTFPSAIETFHEESGIIKCQNLLHAVRELLREFHWVKYRSYMPFPCIFYYYFYFVM